MQFISTRALAVVAIASVACGCAHQQLRWNTVRQSRTLTDIYEQQVLDNLAMFVYDPNSLPFFSFPNAGASNVTDQGMFATAVNWTRGGPALSSGNFGGNASRSMVESWTLTPIIDPVKLQLMRCAYQQVVSACGIGEMSAHCPDCEKMRSVYLGRDVDPELAGCSENYKAKCNPAASAPQAQDEVVPCPPTTEESAEAQRAQRSATAAPEATTPNNPDFPSAVDTDCLIPTCWIDFGCKKCMPKHGKCLKVGHYCDMYIWVKPGGQNELTKLTLNILNYAYNDPTPQRTKNVTWELETDGTGGGCAKCPPKSKPVECDQTAYVYDAAAGGGDGDKRKITVEATLPFDEPVVPFTGNNVCRTPATVNVFERPRLQFGKSQPSAIPSAGYLNFQQNATNLAPSR